MNHNFKFFWQFLKPYKWYYALMFQAPFLCGFYFIFYNYGVKMILDAVEVNKTFSLGAFLVPVLIFASSEVYVNLVWRVSNYAGLKVHPVVKTQIAHHVYTRVLHYDYKFFQDTPSGSIISKAKGIVDGFYAVFGSLHHNISMQVIHTLFPAIAICIVSVKLSLIVITSTSVFCFIMFVMSKKLNELGKNYTDTQHEALAKFGDMTSNIFTVLSFSSRLRELKNIRTYMDEEMIPKDRKAFRYFIKMQWIGMIFYTYMLSCAMIYTIYLRYSEGISIGDFSFVMGLVFISVDHSWRFTSEIQNFIQQLGQLRSSMEILNHDANFEYKTLPSIPKVALNTGGEVEITNLHFTYGTGADVFEDFHLKIPAGQKIGIVGHSGSGKSSLVNILLKNLKPQQGTVKICGYDISQYNEDSVREQIALIPQDTNLFHRSLMQNIGYADSNIDIKKAEEISKIVHLHDTIKNLPLGYDTLVGERGVKLSGGQRQRVAIARAMLKSAPIMILDEATSSLDSVTEAQIQQSLNEILKLSNSTVIAIAHRLSTIKHMDRIIVMQGGKIVEDGTLQELLAMPNGHFKELWESQIGGMLA